MKNEKNISTFKKLLIIALCIVTIFSCKQKNDPVNIANDHNSAKFPDSNEESNSRFIVDAANDLLFEIQLAQLAENNSIKQDIREMAKVIEADYKEAYSSLKHIAENKTITIPSQVSANNKKICNKISYEIADDFDKKYFDLAEKDHKDVIAQFEKIKDEASDPEIKAWTERTLHSLRKNMDLITIFHQKLIIVNDNKPKI